MHNSQSASIRGKGPSWSYGSWIYNYQYHQWLSPLTLWVLIQLRRGVLETTLCDKVCPWLSGGRWFSLGTLVSSTNKIDHHDITEMLLKVALNTITTSIWVIKHSQRNVKLNVHSVNSILLVVLYMYIHSWAFQRSFSWLCGTNKIQSSP
jgi:hypothetical protein